MKFFSAAIGMKNEKPDWLGMKAQPGLILILIQPGETGLNNKDRLFHFAIKMA